MKVALDRGDVERLSPLGIDPTVRALLRAWQEETNDPWLILGREQDSKLNR